ncbi:tetratricopeptide repeat protein [Clostridium sp.]|jgi:tetratricopeptide (TPR) repeat protein|uniref:tetratricopeptide repeat protein n=1 Tax=Clostridium sp. TaxID=1506 RepID=UPI0025843746|nr:tetratricopeptide repeat protein [Clostridium sp.]MDF2505569.1 tetratricopeptide repeat protein [Clostridium sp.]
MQTKLNFAEKVSKLIFLEFKKESIPKIFKIQVNENLYLPVRPLRVADKVKAGEKFEKIPVSFFIEGMFYVLGGDENFKFNNIYIDILNANKEEAVQYIKGIIFDEVKSGSYEDAYLIIKGLLKIENNEENYDKLFMILEKLRKIDKAFQEEELIMLSKAEKIEGYYKAYFNKAVIYYEQDKYEDAWFYINTYIEKSHDDSTEVLELKHVISNIREYEKGKALVYDKPKDALIYLIPLLDEFSNDAILNFNIAVAYRVLGNYEKAIYYLNEAVAIDSSIVEVINELGLNYAALNNFDVAIKYLRKAFEATKSIEVCTNLVMCYLNKGDTKQAKLHYDIAKKIDPKDEIVVQLSKVME